MSDRHRFITRSRGPVTATSAWRARADERERALPHYEVSRIVFELVQRASHSDLAALFAIGTGTELPVRGIRTADLIAAIESSVQTGRFVVVDGWEIGDGRRSAIEDARATPEDRLAQAVMNSRATLSFEGRSYRLASSRLWSGGGGPGDYRLVPVADARVLVSRMSEKIPVTPEERATWAQISKQLTNGRGDGLVLLRLHSPPVGAPRNTDLPVVTPSQIRSSVAQTDWIEIEIVHEDGTPYQGNCIVELPGGRKTEGAPDDKGIVRMEGLDPGTCDVYLPALDGAAWSRR